MQSTPKLEPHYFIEILPNNSVVYGIIKHLTPNQHRKYYFQNTQDFYQHLNQESTNLGLKTLVFFHGWLSDYPFRFSAYIDNFHKNYIIPNKIQRTISVIWHTNGRGYRASRAYVKTIARDFKEDFKVFNQFLVDKKQPSYLLCHSMGNFLFQNLVSETQLPQLGFDHYILAAPDLDCDVFEKGEDFEKLPTLIPQITLLKHKNDRTLGISKILLNRNRLGRHGFINPTPSVKTIDTTRFSTKGIKDGFTHHLYMYKCPKVVAIIGDFLQIP